MRSLILALSALPLFVFNIYASLKRVYELVFTLCLGVSQGSSYHTRCIICGVAMCEREECALSPPRHTSVSISHQREMKVISGLSSIDPRWIHLVTAKRGSSLDSLYALSNRLSHHLAIELDHVLKAQCFHDVRRGSFDESTLSQPILICSIPARRSSVLRRGVSPQHLFMSALCESLERISAMIVSSQTSSIRLRYRALNLLRRAQMTPSQRGLIRLDRAYAQIDSLSADSARATVRDHVVILVDDVITTGGTLREGARALIKAGARSVVGVTMFAVIDP